MTEVAAIVACVILGGLGIFQFLLISGMPIARFAWGGSYDVLPLKMRIASFVSIALYLLFGLLILNKVHIIDIFSSASLVNTAMWVTTVYFFVGIVMNAISRSKPERLTMTPVAAALALLFLYVTLNA